MKFTFYFLAVLLFVAFFAVFFIIGAVLTTIMGVEYSSLGLIITLLVSPTPGFFLARKYAKASFAGQRLIEAEKRSISEENQLRQAERWNQKQRVLREVDTHHVALTRNLRRAIKKNDYGAVLEDNREAQIVEFLASVGIDTTVLGYEETIQLVYETLDLKVDENQTQDFDPTKLPINGFEFEAWVADALGKFGWDAQVTQGSGDQGIDVIAQKQGKSIGLQCKLYSGAVGNKAVQEALAGTKYHGLDLGAVISNAEYTRSAKDLAATAGILLIAPSDLPDLENLVFR